jgi:hypothetical protein
MLENLFKFEIVMVDGAKEEEKLLKSQKMGMETKKEPVDIIMGEAECPYYDLISITDRWLPTEESYQNALNGQFDACSVVFLHSGTYVVPWPKRVFKKRYNEFVSKLPQKKQEKEVQMVGFTKAELMDALKNFPEDD